jgi:hypothetical protein
MKVTNYSLQSCIRKTSFSKLTRDENLEINLQTKCILCRISATSVTKLTHSTLLTSAGRRHCMALKYFVEVWHLYALVHIDVYISFHSHFVYVKFVDHNLKLHILTCL